MFDNIFKWSDGLPTNSTDLDAIHDNVSGEIAAITEKTSLADNDLVLIEDSAASNAKKKSKISTFLAKARSILFLNEITTPSTPPSGQVSLYAKDGGLPFVKNDAGVESPIALGGVWQYYTPASQDGWTAMPGGIYRYFVIGKTVFCQISIIAGTSNGTDARIGLPITPDPNSYAVRGTWGWAMDNGVQVNPAGGYVINVPDSKIRFMKTSIDSGTSWTNSGTKRIYCMFFYFID